MPDNVEPKPKFSAERGVMARIGSIAELQAAVWEVIDKLRVEIGQQGTLMDSVPLKACHAVGTLAGVYARLHEINDLDSRLAEVERRLSEGHAESA
jgi:hypothetical protein